MVSQSPVEGDLIGKFELLISTNNFYSKDDVSNPLEI
jgi:hypothetical protein